MATPGDQEELQRVNARLRALLDAVPDAIVRVDAQGRLLGVHSPAGAPLPVSAEQLVGKPVCNFLPPEQQAPMQDAIRRALDTGEVQHLQYSVVYPEGPRTFHSRLVRSAPGEVLVIRQDITAQTKAEQEHRYLAMLVEHMQEAVVTVDMEGHVLTWSKGAERMYGWTAEEMAGKSIFKLLQPELGDVTPLQHFPGLLQAGEGQELAPRTRKDGTRLWVSVTYVALRDGAGSPTALLGVARDVTELQATRAQLQASEAGYRAVLAAMTEGVVVRSGDGALVTANAAAERILGLDREQLEGRTPPPEGWLRLGEDGTPTTGPRVGTVALRTGQAVTGKVGGIRKPNGDTTWVSQNAQPFHLPGGRLDGVLITFTDITEQRQAHQRDLDAARLHGLDERLNEVELVVRMDGSILHANDRALQAYGYTREELRALRMADLRAPETQALVAAQMAEAASTGIRFETVHRRKDGSRFPVEVSSRGFTVGMETFLHSLVRDLTETRRADADRRLLSGLVSRMADGVIVADAELRITEYTGRAQDIYGWTREEALGKSLAADFVSEFPKRDQEEVQRRLAAGQDVRSRLRARRKDGSWADLDSSVTALRDGQGHVVGWLSVARDIGPQMAAERALKETQARLARVLQGSNDGFFDWDVETGAVVRSPRAAEMLGERPEDLAPTQGAWLAHVHPEDAAALRAEVQEVVEGRRALLDREYRVLTRTGETRWLQSRAKRVDAEAGGRGVCVSGVISDVTERHRAQEQLLEALAHNQQLVVQLQDALQNVKTLSGLIPMCMYCHKIRNDGGYWQRLEKYIVEHTQAMLSHGLCPECEAAHYPEEP